MRRSSTPRIFRPLLVVFRIRSKPRTRRRALRHNKVMPKSVEGVYRNGKVELKEPIAEPDGSRVIVTWPVPMSIDLRERGIDEVQASDLRRRLSPFAEDWDRPEMAAYDELPTG